MICLVARLLCVFLFLDWTTAVHRNPYKVLGASSDATQAEIKQAFKHLAVKYHPDKVKGQSEKATSKYIEIKEAYELLSDEQRRREYDEQHQQFKGASLLSDLSNLFRSGRAQPASKSSFVLLTRSDFRRKVLGSDKPWIIQISATSSSSRFATLQWEGIASQLSGDVNFGRIVRASDPAMVDHLVQSVKGLLWVSIFQQPGALEGYVIGIPPQSQEVQSGSVFSGKAEIAPVTDFVASNLMKLPQIREVEGKSFENRVSEAVAKGRVVIVVASEHPAPALSTRVAAGNFSDQIIFKHLHIADRQIRLQLADQYSIRALPAALVFTDPEVKPVVYKSSRQKPLDVMQIAAGHILPLVPPLNVDTVASLGCGWGPGVALENSKQACAVLAGSSGEALLKARAKLARVASSLRRSAAAHEPLASKYIAGSLQFAWLDAANSNEFIHFHIVRSIQQRDKKFPKDESASRLGWLSLLRKFWLPSANSEERVELIVYSPGASAVSQYIHIPHRFSVFSENFLGADSKQITSWLSKFLESDRDSFGGVRDWPPRLIRNTLMGKVYKLLRNLSTSLMEIIDSLSQNSEIRWANFWYLTGANLKANVLMAFIVAGITFWKTRSPIVLVMTGMVSVLAALFLGQDAGLYHTWQEHLAVNLRADA